MYEFWDANLIVIAVTLVTVAASVLVHYEGLMLLSKWLSGRHEAQRRRNVLYGIFGVLGLHITEIWIFGVAIWAVLHYPNTGSVSGVHQLGLFDSVYLSAATFTTVGFGDLAPVGPLRFLSGTTAITGFVMIGWSASFTFLEMQRFWRR
jgi:hypothetical protein